MSDTLADMTPSYDAKFRAEAFVGTFQIVSLNVRYDFDDSLEHIFARQEFEVRRIGSAACRWCAAVRINTHLECSYEDSASRPLESALILDSSNHHYVVCDFPDSIVSGTGTFRFVIRMKKRSELSEQHSGRKNEKAFFITQIYGGDCSNCRMLVSWPSEYSLINSIPRLTRNSDGYVCTPTVHKFEPVEVALVLRRGFLGRLRRTFSRDAHPVVWVLMATGFSIALAAVWKILKSITNAGE